MQDNRVCESTGTYRSLLVVFVCDPTVPHLVVTSVSVQYDQCSYEVHVVSAYACSAIIPPPPLAATSSTGAGNEFFSVDGRTFTAGQLTGVIVGAVAVLALLSACCYLIGRRRNSAQDTTSLLDGEGVVRPEGVVGFRLPVPRRRPATRSCSTNDTTGSQPCACGGEHHTGTGSSHPGAMSYSAAGSYGVV